MADYKDRYDRLLAAIEAERAAEEEYFKKLSTSKSLKERIAAGVLWHPVSINRKHYTVGEHVELELIPSTPSASKSSNNFKVGASAVFFIKKEERLEFKGAISFANRRKVRIIISADVIAKEHLLRGGSYGIELIYDDRTFRVMKDSIRYLKKANDPVVQELKSAVASEALDQHRLTIEVNEDGLGNLNTSQINAVKGAMSLERLAVIHGPPGTGKTTTLVGMIKKLVQSKEKVLVTAPSNGAVDLLAKRLSDVGVNVLRLGNVTRIGDNIAELCLDEQIRNHKEWQHIKQVKIEAEAAHREAGKFKRKYGAQQRMNKGLMYKEAKQLENWARELEDKLVDKVIDESEVICTTLIGCASKTIHHLRFDTVVIDEASQALEPESWTAMLKGTRVIMAGDHKQLPPTVKSSKAKNLEFERTILDRMITDPKVSFLLDTQYRMNPAILGFSNQLMYNGQLKTDDSVLKRTSTFGDEPLVFIDTSGCGFDEEINAETLSRANHQEYLMIREHVLSIYDLLEGKSIGLISPYKEQVRLMRREVEQDQQLRSLDIEINSIDGFQGQEKDVIYLSLVRSNDNGEIGFLKDYRRLNVALTRAREKLVIVGDMATLGMDQVYLDLADFVETSGRYQSAWEYMTS